jgi:hypothetical protein
MALGKFFKREEPTPVSEPSQSNSGDIEKARPSTYADGDHYEGQRQIDPEVEKRLVRKLDRNVVSLVMVLCIALSNATFQCRNRC